MVELAGSPSGQSPISTIAFTAFCGLCFMIVGGFFLARTGRVVNFAKQIASRTGRGPEGPEPNVIQVRNFGILFLVAGVMLVAFSVFLLLN